MPETRRRLTAAEGVEAACILFRLNTEQAAILGMAAHCGFPPALLEGESARTIRTEWRAFVHAAVTASLMQHAPSEVVMAYLRRTHALLAACAASDAGPSPLPGESPDASAAPLPEASVNAFVDGPFSAYMPHLAQGDPRSCPALFCRRTGLDLPPEAALAVQARLAAVMALLISTLNDKLEGYDIAGGEL